MTRVELEQYIWLRQEIERQGKRLNKLNNKKEHEAETVVDSVLNYKTGHGIPTKIEGTPADSFSLPVEIKLTEEAIKKNIAESKRALNRIEEFIQQQDDARTREILRLRYIDGLDWERVAEEVHFSPDHVRHIAYSAIK